MKLMSSFLSSGVFIALGFSAVVPLLHYMFLEGFWDTISSSAMLWLILMSVLYVTGALIYAFRIPERFYPGRFDIWVCLT